MKKSAVLALVFAGIASFSILPAALAWQGSFSRTSAPGTLTAALESALVVEGAPRSLDTLIPSLEAAGSTATLRRIQRGEPVVFSEGDAVFPLGETISSNVQAYAAFTWISIGTGKTVTKETALVEGKTLLHISSEIVISRIRPGKIVQEIYADLETLRIVRCENSEYGSNGSLTVAYTETVDHDANKVTVTRAGQTPVVTQYPLGHEITTHALVPFQARGRAVAPGQDYPTVILGDPQALKVKVVGESTYDGKPTYKIESTPDRIQAHVTRDALRLPLWCELVRAMLERSRPGTRDPKADQRLRLLMTTRVVPPAIAAE